jgi:hypothetical protein|tara:strand:- start:375 stop:902 length:528 start_codon:yes stop_codon:yes gene_type:complete
MATNLEFIKSETVTNGSSTFSVTDIFSAHYDVYYISLDAGNSGSAASDINAQLIDGSGSAISNTNYEYGNIRHTTGSSTTADEQSTNNAHFPSFIGLAARTQANASNSGSVYIYNPFSSSSYTFVNGNSIDTLGAKSSRYVGVLKETTSCTGIKFIPNNGSATLNTFKVSVYGVK